MTLIAKTLSARTYTSPEASPVDVREEQCFVATTGSLQDMDPNPLYEDEFDDDNN